MELDRRALWGYLGDISIIFREARDRRDGSTPLHKKDILFAHQPGEMRKFSKNVSYRSSRLSYFNISNALLCITLSRATSNDVESNII